MKNKLRPRYALVIGNDTYASQPLNNACSDANAICELLSYKGFAVTVQLNLNSEKMHSSLDSFISLIKDKDAEILFYFAGHGCEINAKNYLLPIDNDNHDNFSYIALSLNTILEKLKLAQNNANLIFLDCCRTDPTQFLLKDVSGRSAGNGITIPDKYAKIDAYADTFIAFSTAPGQTAFDSSSQSEHGLFTDALLKFIPKYNITINKLMQLVREDVIKRSDYKQIPWDQSSLRRSFSFDNYQTLINHTRNFDFHSQFIYKLKFSHDDNLLFACGDSNIFTAFVISNGGQYDISFCDEKCDIESIDISADGTLLCAVNSHGVVKTYTFSSVPTITELNTNKFKIFSISISGDNNFVAASTNNGRICIFDTTKTIKTKFISHHKTPIYACRFHPKLPSILAFSHNGSKLLLYNIQSYKPIKNCDIKYNYTYDIQFSIDGKYAVTTHSQGHILIWDATSFTLIHDVSVGDKISNPHSLIEIERDGNEPGSNDICCATISPISEIVAVGTSQPSIVFIDLRFGEIISETKLDISVGQVQSIAFSNNGKLLAITGSSFTNGRKVFVYCN